MSQRSRLAGFAAAAALAISAVTFFAVSPAIAAATGTLTQDGSGGLVVTYSGVSQNDNIDFVAQVAGTSCNTQNPADEIAVLTTDPQAPVSWGLPASPFSVVVGTNMIILNNGPMVSGPLPAGPYTFCLRNVVNNQPITVAQLDMTLGQAPPPTTAAPTTTTAPASDPVAPAFTG